MLKCLMTAGITNANFAKVLKVRRKMATRWIKENQVANVLEEPDDNNDIVN